MGREWGGSGEEWGGSGEGVGREWGGSGEGVGREWGGSGEDGRSDGTEKEVPVVINLVSEVVINRDTRACDKRKRGGEAKRGRKKEKEKDEKEEPKV